MLNRFRLRPMLVLVSMLCLVMLAFLHDAIASVATSPADDPAGTALQLLQLIKEGRALPAVGAGLCLAVAAARAGLGAWVTPWFKTKLGGYVLGFGSASALYLGTSFLAGQGVTLSLLLYAIGVGWTAAGGLETFRDVLGALGIIKTPAAARAT